MRARALVAALVGPLLLVAGDPARAATDPAAPMTARVAAPDVPVNAPMTTTWDLGFAITARYDYRLDFGPGEWRGASTTATATGSISEVRDLPGSGLAESPSSVRALRTTSGTSESHLRSDRGRIAEDCNGDTAWPGDDQRPVVLTDPGSRREQLTPWQQLSVVVTCTDNQGNPPSSRVSTLPGLSLPRLTPWTGDGGTRTSDFARVVEYTPEPGDARCPDELGENTTRCELFLDAKVTLRLTRVQPSARPTSAVVGRDGSEVAVGILCPTTCTADLVVRAKGRSRVLARTTRSLPAEARTVTVPVPRVERRRLVSSGGARVSIRYAFDHGVTARETRVGSLS